MQINMEIEDMSIKTLVEIDMDWARKSLAIAGFIPDCKSGSDDEIKDFIFKAIGCYGVKDANTNFVEQKVYDEEFAARKDAELETFKIEKKLNKYKKAVSQIQNELEEEVNEDYRQGLRRALQIINSSVSGD